MKHLYFSHRQPKHIIIYMNAAFHLSSLLLLLLPAMHYFLGMCFALCEFNFSLISIATHVLMPAVGLTEKTDIRNGPAAYHPAKEGSTITCTHEQALPLSNGFTLLVLLLDNPKLTGWCPDTL